VAPITLSFIALGCIFGGTVFGMGLRFLLPGHHLSDESRNTVKLGTGMVATMAALVLGLLIASAKGTFDTLRNELEQTSAKFLQLDAVLADYGPETREVRNFLPSAITAAVQQLWPEEAGAIAGAKAQQPSAALRELRKELLRLSPQNDAQRYLQSQALQVAADIAGTRWLLVQQVGKSSLPLSFIVLLIFWLTVIFASFGLFSPTNGTVIVVLFVCVLSAATSLFLILELDQPYQGLIKISSAPLHEALAVMGR